MANPAVTTPADRNSFDDIFAGKLPAVGDKERNSFDDIFAGKLPAVGDKERNSFDDIFAGKLPATNSQPDASQQAGPTFPSSAPPAPPQAPPQPGPMANMWNKLEQVPIAGAIPGAMEEAWHHPLLAIPRVAAGFVGGAGEGLEMPASLASAGVQTAQGMAGVPESERFKIPSFNESTRKFAEPLLKGGDDTRPHHGGEDLYNIGSVAGQMVGSAPYGGLLTRAGGAALEQLAQHSPQVAAALETIMKAAAQHPQAANIAKDAGIGTGADVAFESADRQAKGQGLGASPMGMALGAGVGGLAGALPKGSEAAGEEVSKAPRKVSEVLKAETPEYAPVQTGPKKFSLEAGQTEEAPPQFNNIEEAVDAFHGKNQARADAAAQYLKQNFGQKPTQISAPVTSEQPASQYSPTDIDLKGKSFVGQRMIPREDIDGIHAPEGGSQVDWSKPDELQTVDMYRPVAKGNVPKTDSLGQPVWRKTPITGYVRKVDGQDFFDIEKRHGERHEFSRIQDSIAKSQSGNSDAWRARKSFEELTPEDKDIIQRQEPHTLEEGTRPVTEEAHAKHLARLKAEVPEISDVPDLGKGLANFISQEEGSARAGYPLEVATNVAKSAIKAGKTGLDTVNKVLSFRKDSDIIKQHEGKFEMNGLEHELYRQIAKEHMARLEGNVHFDYAQSEEARKLLTKSSFTGADIRNPANSPHLTDTQREFVVEQKNIRQGTRQLIDDALEHLEGQDNVPEELEDTLKRWKDSQFGKKKEKDSFGDFMENLTANIYQSQFSGNIGNELLQATDPLIFGTSRVGPATMAKAYWTVLTDPKVRNYLSKLGLKGDMAIRRQALLEKQGAGWKALNKPLEVKVGKHTLSTTGSPSEALNSAVMFTAGVIHAGQKAAKKGMLSDITKSAGSQYLHNYIDWVETGALKGGMTYDKAIDATVHGIKAVEDTIGGATLNMDKDPMQRSAVLRMLAPFSRQQIRVARLFRQYAQQGDMKSLAILTGMITAAGGSAIIPKELVGARQLTGQGSRQYAATKEFLDTLNAPRYAGLNLEQKIQMATYNISQALPTELLGQIAQEIDELHSPKLTPDDKKLKALGLTANILMMAGATPFGIGAGQLGKMARAGTNLKRGYAKVGAYSDYGQHLASGIEPYNPEKALFDSTMPGIRTGKQNWITREKLLSDLKKDQPYAKMKPEEAQAKSQTDLSQLLKNYPTDTNTTKRY